MKYSYSFPTDIRFGPGVIKELAPYLKDQNLSHPLIVTDPNVAELDFFKKIVEDLKRQQLKLEIFCDIHKNPVKSDVLKGGDAYHQSKRDSVIGIGGGAAMDVARAIVLRINHHRDLFDYDDLVGGSKYVTEPVPHFITVPTTAGTGSEVGRSAVISEEQTKKKRILFHHKLVAKMVFADPELTYDLPPFITAATGMDALSHNMEAFLARGFHPLCDGIALEGIRLISGSLDNAVNKPLPESRSKMMIASLMGAVAFQKGLGVVHSLAHPLSTLLNMHHGLAIAINLPYGMQFNIPGQEDPFIGRIINPTYKRIANAMGLTSLDGESVVSALLELNQKIGLPAKLGEAGVKKEHIEQLTDLAVDDFCHPCNPRKVTREDFKQLYLDAL
ncbi:MAG: iron-containing alcohol dehydrogenase [Cytophagales bacterium]|nr:iron-containing alcohol dehydrogenase [Cytophagales bacterium]